MSTQSTEPWDAILKHFQEQANGSQEFARIQRSGRKLAGIIICGWDENGDTPDYLHDAGSFAPFDDVTPQYPKIYVTLRGITRALDNIRNRKGNWEFRSTPDHVGLAHWMHPEAFFQPIPELIKLQNEFPGCLRQ